MVRAEARLLLMEKCHECLKETSSLPVSSPPARMFGRGWNRALRHDPGISRAALRRHMGRREGGLRRPGRGQPDDHQRHPLQLVREPMPSRRRISAGTNLDSEDGLPGEGKKWRSITSLSLTASDRLVMANAPVGRTKRQVYVRCGRAR